MGIGVIVFGKSGSGKSRSLKKFADDEILYINVEGKPLPFRNRFKNIIHTCNGNEIKQAFESMPQKKLKVAVVDDAGYLMTEYFMRHHRDNKGGKVYDLYNDIGDLMFNVLSLAKQMPNDTIIYYMFHEDKNNYGDVAIRTIGKMLDNVVCIEGMYTIVLRCMSDKGKHFFLTSTDGDDITKTPEDMFDKQEIDNDLKYVDSVIREYYGI